MLAMDSCVMYHDELLLGFRVDSPATSSHSYIFFISSHKISNRTMILTYKFNSSRCSHYYVTYI